MQKRSYDVDASQFLQYGNFGKHFIVYYWNKDYVTVIKRPQI